MVAWTIQDLWDSSRRGHVYIPWAEVLSVDVEVCDVVVLPGEDEPKNLACRRRGGEADIWLGGVRLDSFPLALNEEVDNEWLKVVFFIGGKLLQQLQIMKSFNLSAKIPGIQDLGCPWPSADLACR